MRLCLRVTLTLWFVVGIVRAGVADEYLRTTPAFLWGYGFGAKPRFPFVADVNHDGFDDLVCVYPPGDAIIDVALNGRGEKSLGARAVLHGFGKDCLAANVGELDGTPGADVVGLFANGEVRVAHSFANDKFPANDLWVKLTTVPKEPLIAVADFDGDKRNDVLIAGKDGSLVLLLNDKSSPKPVPLVAAFPHRPRSIAPCGRLVAADFDGRGRADIVWADADGNVWRAEVVINKTRAGRTLQLRHRSAGILPATTADRMSALRFLAVGDVDGDGRMDLLIGSQLLRFVKKGRRTKTIVVDLPESAKLVGSQRACEASDRNAVECRLADINGDKRADAVCYRREDDRNTGSDILVCLTYRVGDRDADSDGLPEWAEVALGTDPLRRDTDGDGLLDGWEANGVRGLNLPAMGADPRHKDVLVQVQRFEDVKEEDVKREFQRVVAFYVNLPVDNVDGKRGIALHPIFNPPMSLKECGSKGWGENGDKHFPKEHHGICHWMQITNSGGGQSSMMGIMGSCGGHALYATFIHEFGHQLGLDHTGQWAPAWCPLYTSLMNYAYSYQLNGKGSEIRYSAGEFCGTVLNETSVSEKLPYPMEKVEFLAGPPYRYKLKADGNVTWIDWNRNGVFDTAPVRADINYGYSTSGGDRKFLGDQAIAAPFLCALGTPPPAPPARGGEFRSSLPASEAQRNSPPLAGGAGGGVDLKQTPDDKLFLFYVREGGALVMRTYQGSEKWSDPTPVTTKVVTTAAPVVATSVANEKVTGDPVAASDGKEVHLFYSTDTGIAYRHGVPPNWSEATLIPDSKGQSPSVVLYQGKVILFCHTDAKSDVTYRIIADGKIGAARRLGVKSAVPPGATVDTLKNELIVGMAQDQDEKRPTRFQVRRFVWESDEKGLAQRSMEWVGGEDGSERGSRRPVLIFESSPEVGPEGRLHYVVAGMITDKDPKACTYDCMTISDKTYHHGWLTKRYYDEWTQSSSAPAACWFNNDIVLASRWYGTVRTTKDGSLYVAHFGLGIQSEPMGDFDDVGYIVRYGLERSILWLGAMGK